VPVRLIARHVSALGAELVAALLALTASAWLFGWLAEGVTEGDTSIDMRFANWLHEHATPGWTTFFENVTKLGNLGTLSIVVTIAALLLWRLRQTAELLLLLLAAVGAEFITVGLKLGFQRDRPFFADPLATESTYSFPSGHASVSLAVYGTLGFIVARHLRDRRAQLLTLVASGALALLIGFSRLYLGVHFLSDVIAGFSLGIAWVSLCIVLLHLHLRVKERRQTSRYRASAQQ
jgi:membrane-associated phospholipid phosphatase